MSDTNAVKWLRAQGADFEVLEYAFTEIGAEHAAEAVNRPLEGHCTACFSGDYPLDLDEDVGKHALEA